MCDRKLGPRVIDPPPVSNGKFCFNDLKLVLASGVWANPRVKLAPTHMYH